MDNQYSFIDFKAIMYPTLFTGRVGMISSAVEEVRLNRQAL